MEASLGALLFCIQTVVNELLEANLVPSITGEDLRFQQIQMSSPPLMSRYQRVLSVQIRINWLLQDLYILIPRRRTLSKDLRPPI